MHSISVPFHSGFFVHFARLIHFDSLHVIAPSFQAYTLLAPRMLRWFRFHCAFVSISLHAPPKPFFQRTSNGIFFPCGEFTPIRQIPLGECGKLFWPSANIRKPQKTPPPSSCAENKYIPCFIALCLRYMHSISSPFRSGRFRASTKPHFISPTLQAYTSAPHGFGKYSFPFRKLIHLRFPQALIQRYPNGIYLFLRRVCPDKLFQTTLCIINCYILYLHSKCIFIYK